MQKKLEKQLIDAFSVIKDEKELQAFLKDLFTRTELIEASRRFEIARLLWTTDMSYADIAKKLETSTTTVTRVNKWLRHEGKNGLATVLKRLYTDK